MSALLNQLDALECALVAKGFPAMSPWWRTTIERFYWSAKRQCVLRVGRRGGKSSTLARVAVLEALYGEHKIPPGDVGVVAIISVSRDEANQRLRTVKAILDALHVRFKPIEGGIELEKRPIAFKTFAASVAGVSGFTCVAAICDEVAKWRDNDSGSNPAKEVLASLRPTMATQPNARIFLSSSPLGTRDAHAEAFALGDTDFQMVAHAASWTANPTLTEASTRALEPNEALWSREYGANPSDADISIFTASVIDPCIRPIGHVEPLGLRPIGLFDGSMGRLDSATWATARFVRDFADDIPQHLWMSATRNRGLVREDLLEPTDDVVHAQALPALDEFGSPIPNPRHGWRPRPTLAVWGLGALEGRFARETSFEDMVASAAAAVAAGPHWAARAGTVVGDDYMSFALEPEFRKHGLRYAPMLWSNSTKSRAVLRLRQLFRDKQIAIEPGDEANKLRTELLGFVEKLLPSGVSGYGARGSGHDDRVALLLNACMADVDSVMRGSEIAQSGRRHVIQTWGEETTDSSRA